MSDNKSNINEKFKAGEEVSVDISPDDVKAFLGEATTETTPPKEKKDRIKIDPDPTFQPNQKTIDTVIKDAIIDTRTVDVTDKEKSIYIKALLNDVCVELPIPLMGGKITVVVRARTTYEQSAIFNTLKQDEKEKLIDDIPSYITSLQRYAAVLMIKSINDTPFNNLELKYVPNSEEIDHVKTLRDAVNDKINPLPMTKWHLLLNAVLIFETKMARLAEECINKDFWNPAG